jgi:sugar lactone lactonase YvrE
MGREYAEEPGRRRKRTILLLMLAAAIAAVGIYAAFLHEKPPSSVAGQSSPLPGAHPTASAPNGNLSNMSFVATDGDDLFHSDPSGGGLRAEAMDGTDKRMLDGRDSFFINAGGGFVYCYVPTGAGLAAFGGIMRVRPDGTGQERLADAPGSLSSMYAGPDAIYLTVSEPEAAAGAYSLALSSGAIRRLTESAAGMLNEEGGRLYFKESAAGASAIMSMLPDGTDLRTEISAEDAGPINFCTVADGHIYFTDTGRDLYRTPPAGGGERAIIEAGADISAFNISGGIVYAAAIDRDGEAEGAFTESIYRYGLDGSGRERIAGGLAPGSPIGIVDGKIYFFAAGSRGASTLHRMSMDGTGKEEA